MNQEIINTVYKMLQAREIHPSGYYDGKRWYAHNTDLISVRSPSRSWPWSEMVACRTKKYVTKVCEKYNCETIEELKKHV
jgi:hypothetical protein